jgi:Holliday junction resolvase RusA-like endonuclease
MPLATYKLVIEGRPGHMKKMGINKFGKPTERWDNVIKQSPTHHWRVIRECKVKDEVAVWAAVNAVMAPDKPEVPIQRASLKFTLIVTTQRGRDYDNMMASLKGVIDGLTKSGIIADDNISVIGKPDIEVVVKPKLGYHYVIEVAPIVED